MEALLVQTFRETLVELEKAWKDVGMSLTEQKNQTDNLVKELCDTMLLKVETEQKLFQEYVEEVAKLKEDITIVGRRLDENVCNEAPPSDRSPLVKELTWLRSQYDQLDAKRCSIQSEAEEAMLKLHAIWSALGVRPEPGFEEVGFKLPGRREAFMARLEKANQEKASRTQEVKAAAKAVALILESLDEAPQSEFDRAAVAGDERLLGLSKESLEALAQRKSELEAEKEERSQVLKSLGLQIQPLWERLGVHPTERQAFFERHTGYGASVVEACQQELTRLLTLKRERMDDFIEDARAQIREALDEARADSAERARLAPLLAEPVSAADLASNEALLERHEVELARLETILADLRPIIASCTRYVALVQEREKYEALVQNSARLLDRSRGAASLREEELQRKRVQIDLPKLVTQLLANIPECERKHATVLILNNVFPEQDVPAAAQIKRIEAEHSEKLAREKEQRAREKMSAAESSNSFGGKSKATMANANNTSVLVGGRPRVPLAQARPKN